MLFYIINLLPCGHFCLMWWSLVVLGSEGIHYHILNHKQKCKQLSTEKPGCPLAGWNLIKSWKWKERSETNYKHSGNLADLSLYFLIYHATLRLLWLTKPQSSSWKSWALNYKTKPGHQNINLLTSNGDKLRSLCVFSIHEPSTEAGGLLHSHQGAVDFSALPSTLLKNARMPDQRFPTAVTHPPKLRCDNKKISFGDQ